MKQDNDYKAPHHFVFEPRALKAKVVALVLALIQYADDYSLLRHVGN